MDDSFILSQIHKELSLSVWSSLLIQCHRLIVQLAPEYLMAEDQKGKEYRLPEKSHISNENRPKDSSNH